MAVVKSCREKNVPFDQDNIDRVYRVRSKYTSENTGKKIQSVIVKYKSWKSLKACVRYFFRIFIYQMLGLQILSKIIFISSKKLLFSRYSNFCNFFPFFPHFPDSKGQMEVE